MSDSSDDDSQSASPDETGSTTSSVPLSGLKVVLKLKRSAPGGAGGQSPSKQRRQQKKPKEKEEPKEEPESESEAGEEVVEPTTTSPGRGRGSRGGRGGRGSRGGRGRGRGRGGARLTVRRRRKPAAPEAAAAASSDNEKSGEESGAEEEEEDDGDNASDTAEPAAAPTVSKTPEFVAPLPITPGDITGKKKAGGAGLLQDSSLTKVLTYLHRYLQRKDTQGFFADPVDDEVAPGYSQIITHAMDFSTMHSKIEARRYSSIIDFKRDFKLMCANAMRYNAEETIYYKAAKRLLQLGLKLLSKERLTSLRTTLASMALLTSAEMGFDYTKVKVTDGSSASTAQQLLQGDVQAPQASTSASTAQPTQQEGSHEMSASDIAEQCRTSHRRLLESASNQGRRLAQLGYLRKPEDGATSFVFVSPEGGSGMLTESERVVCLGEYTSGIHAGQGNLFGVNSFKELPQNEIRPVSFHDYGSFCSFAPSYDSTFATLTPEDSSLLLSAYGNDIGVTYAASIKRFVRKAGRVANVIVDAKLENATGGQHSASGGRQVIESKLDEIDRLNQATSGTNISVLLDAVGTKLETIHDLQVDRLSQPPPENLRLTQGPTPRESELANAAVKEMAEVVQYLKPADLVDDPALIRSLLTTFAI